MKLEFTLVFDPKSKVKTTKKAEKNTAMFLFGKGVYDTDLNAFFAWQFKKEKNIDLVCPEFSGHVSLSRGDRDIQDLAKFNQAKSTFHNMKVVLELDIANPRNEGEYWWFNLTPESEKEINALRYAMGLKPHIVTRKLHFTVGLVSNKPKNKMQSEYFASISKQFNW